MDFITVLLSSCCCKDHNLLTTDDYGTHDQNIGLRRRRSLNILSFVESRAGAGLNTQTLAGWILESLTLFLDSWVARAQSVKVSERDYLSQKKSSHKSSEAKATRKHCSRPLKAQASGVVPK